MNAASSLRTSTSHNFSLAKLWEMGPALVLFSALIACCCGVTTARAGVMISVGSTSVSPGGSGLLEVTISGNSDIVQSFQYSLVITPIGVVSSSLQFVSPQTVDFLTDGNYLFVSNSFNQINGLDVRFVFLTNVPQDSFLDIDSTNDFSDVTVGSSRLLARVNLENIIPLGTDPASVLGEQFLVSVTDTFFFDSSSNLVDVGSNSGVVSVNAIPEPASLAVASVLLLSASMMAFFRSFRRRK